MTITRLAFALLLLLAAGSCADLATVPQRVPSALLIEPTVITTTEGQDVRVPVTVLDQEGVAFTEVPVWARARWLVSDAAVLGVAATVLEARSPGAATATASVAGLESSLTIRVNPAQLRLEIAEVEFHQANKTSDQLDPGKPTELRVYLVGDEVNFFRPTVRARLYREGDLKATYEITREEESVPVAGSQLQPEDAWRVTIPGALIQPGVEILLEVDPTGTIPRATGSTDRFPSAGNFALDVRGPQLQLRVRGAYLTQSVQRFDGSVPLIAGRDALLRVFVTGDEPTDLTTAVSVTLYEGSTPARTLLLDRNASIPESFDEGDLGDTWNTLIPGDWLEPGMSMVVEADPDAEIALRDGSEPRFPSEGMIALGVRAVPPLTVRVVPITQSSVGLTGSASSSELGDYIDAAIAKFPLAEIELDVRATYTTSTVASSLEGWLDMLQEIAALRVADGSGRHYYGLLRHPGGVNVAGIGYVGWPAAVGYDQMPHAAETFAHEIGHNFNLGHAPCGGPSSVDPAFPYSNGSIGVYGFDILTGQLKSPSVDKDLMTYCGPEWISDYHYARTMNFRGQASQSIAASRAGRARESALLVWGGLRNGQFILEPAVELQTFPQLPEGSGPYRLTGLDAAGVEVFSYAFAADEIDHAPGAMNFAFAIPASVAQPQRLERIVLSGPDGEVSRVRSALSPSAALEALDTEPGRIGLPALGGFQMATIRDAGTGEILSFVRAGSTVEIDRPVEVLLSDGVRTARTVLQNP